MFNNETEAICKHLVGACRQLNIKHYVLPKFQLQTLTQLFKVRRMTCFSILDDFTTDPKKAEFLKRFDEHDNRAEGENIEKVKNSEYMFKTVTVKKWEVIKNVKENRLTLKEKINL